MTSICFYLAVKKNKNYLKIIAIVGLFILLFLEFKNSNIKNLYTIDSLQNDTISKRLNEYPSLPFPLAHIMESKITVIYYRLQKNISDILSPNLFFFGNHPNERASVNEFEKFPYILLPFFILGVLKTNYKKNKKIFLLFSLLPIALIAIFGDTNPLGPFSLFPIFIYFISESIELSPIFIVIFVLVFIQTLIYAKS